MAMALRAYSMPKGPLDADKARVMLLSLKLQFGSADARMRLCVEIATTVALAFIYELDPTLRTNLSVIGALRLHNGRVFGLCEKYPHPSKLRESMANFAKTEKCENLRTFLSSVREVRLPRQRRASIPRSRACMPVGLVHRASPTAVCTST